MAKAKLPVGRVVERKKTGKKLKPVSAYLELDVYERLRQHAMAEGRQMSWIIASLVRQYLESLEDAEAGPGMATGALAKLRGIQAEPVRPAPGTRAEPSSLAPGVRAEVRRPPRRPAKR